ncbi:MAG: hypothetical protein WCD86_10380 [Ktedonobacteraceae bacterium]
MSSSRMRLPPPALSTTPRLILGWLLCYPFQSARDLALALGKDASVVAVHLRELAALGLVESLAPAWLDGRLWSLTGAGLRLLGQALESDPAQLAKAWRADRAARERTIARLFSIVPVERFVLDLCIHAPAGLAPLDVGRRPAVRWHWLRGWRHRFAHGQQALTVQADAVVVWLREPRGRSGSMLLSGQAVPDQPNSGTWQCAFIICERDLEDRASLQQRLARLFQYRESAERWATYQQFPPILALLKHPHHTERWRRELQALTQAQHAAPLAGAMAALPAERGDTSDPWRLSWENFADGSPERLSDVLTPVPRAAWPDGVRDHIAATRAVMLPLATRRMSKIPATQPLPPHRSFASSGPRTENHWLPSLSMQLGRRHLAALTLLAQHPLLSTGDISALMNIKDDSAAHYLRELWQRDCVCSWQMSDNETPRWWLSDGGLRLIAAIQDFPIQRLGSAEKQAGRSGKTMRPLLIPRALPPLLRYPLHTTGVYSFMAALHRAADARAVTITWWETGATCERSYPPISKRCIVPTLAPCGKREQRASAAIPGMASGAICDPMPNFLCCNRIPRKSAISATGWNMIAARCVGATLRQRCAPMPIICVRGSG